MPKPSITNYSEEEQKQFQKIHQRKVERHQTQSPFQDKAMICLPKTFSALVDLVSSVSSYTPNETKLTAASLTTFHGNLQTTNTNVMNAEVVYSNAIISRNTVLYTENIGLVDIALEVKKYVKAVFGATSPQYKQISGIKFTNRKE